MVGIHIYTKTSGITLILSTAVYMDCNIEYSSILQVTYYAVAVAGFT